MTQLAGVALGQVAETERSGEMKNNSGKQVALEAKTEY